MKKKNSIYAISLTSLQLVVTPLIIEHQAEIAIYETGFSEVTILNCQLPPY